MILFLAMSCLQGRPALNAAFDLMGLAPGVVGLQLTPGCTPTEIDPTTLPCAKRTHHGYTPEAYRSRVWSRRGEIVWTGDSVHPPLAKEIDGGRLTIEQIEALPEGTVLETMYPSYAWLSSGSDIIAAMDRRLSLAVDVSHVAIMVRLGLLTIGQCGRLFDYDRIVEVHVSRSVGHRDSHMPLEHDASDFGIEWAKERLRAGTPIVLEAYFHKLSVDERKRQIDVLLER